MNALVPLPVVAVSAATAELVWLTSLALFAIVLVVVAVLLHIVLRTAQRIEGGVARIWTVGKNIARNTVQLVVLEGVNRAVTRIFDTAGRLHRQLERIRAHAQGCDGCPACVLGRSPGGTP